MRQEVGEVEEVEVEVDLGGEEVEVDEWKNMWS